METTVSHSRSREVATLMRLIELVSGDCRVQIDPLHGGRIASLEVAGLSLLVDNRPEPNAWGCYPMAPWAGRIRDGRFSFAGRSHSLPLNFGAHAIHGTTFDRPWCDEGDGTLSIELGDRWPFSGYAVQQFALRDDALELRLEVHANAEPFPASLGWHPWFVRRLERGDSAVLSFSPDAMYRRDDVGIPTGELVPPPPGPWDDCFTGMSAPPRVRWPGAISLVLESDVDHWVVYDEPAHALCIEPQTGPPAALNIAPRIVSPGEPLVSHLAIRWTLDG